MLTKRDLLRSAALAAITASTANSVPAQAQTKRRTARLPQGQGHCRGRLHLRPADRDELRRDVRICRRPEFRAVQGAVQPDQERAQRLHLQGHGHRHAEQRHALFVPMAGPARRADRPFGPGGGRSATTRCMLCDGNTFNYGYIGSRATGNEAGDYMVVGPDWKGATPPGIKKVFRSTHAIFGGGISHPALQSGRHADNVEKVQAGYKAQPLSAYLKQPATVGAADDRLSQNRQGAREDELLRVSRLRAAVRARQDRKRRRSAPSSRASASAPARPSTSRTSRWSTSPKSAWA